MIHVEGNGHAVPDLLLVEIDLVVEGDDAKDVLVGRMLRHVRIGDTDAMSVMQTGDFDLGYLQVVENDVSCERERRLWSSSRWQDDVPVFCRIT